MRLFGCFDWLRKQNSRRAIATNQIESFGVDAAGAPGPRRGGAKVLRVSRQGFGMVDVHMIEDVVFRGDQGLAGA